MIDRLISWFAPHICEGCGATGSGLCDRCNKDILAHPWRRCVSCLQVVSSESYRSRGAMCIDCRRQLPFRRVFIVGERTKVLQRLIGNFKYFSQRDYRAAIARLLSATLPDQLPNDLEIVFVPTAAKRIRERGFDHMQLVARQLAKQRGLTVAPVVRRLGNQAQHSANRTERRRQAESTFALRHRLIPKKVLLIDDIYTTGATTQAIATLLRRAGTAEVWLAVVARQTEN